MISELRLRQLIVLLQSGREDDFYGWPEWKSIRLDVLRIDAWECQYCKARGKFRGAKIVHHVKHLRDRPDLALSIWDGEERQLVSVCKKCHELEHPESQRQYGPKSPPITEERWD